ncbi:hypothetical protein CK203_064354 [Vitis vinifera]|uniref:Uncharacterized protein n=1 Tax=Vitis vinifera TaxID=29760 RepID=A0A438FPE4_VITVI|nr:hypothetical protein CK203_064354 [Vitis vinifera]
MRQRKDICTSPSPHSFAAAKGDGSQTVITCIMEI